MFCWDDELVAAMIRANMKTVLCVGSGISREPRALAEAGFTVVAMDLSPAAIEIARSIEFTADAVESFFDPKLRRPGGSIEFVVGNFLDPSVCSGPFDVIIERRTGQLFATRDLDSVMSCLSNRLNENGIFFSHCHGASWKPPADPVHYAESWFHDNGWNAWYGEGEKPTGRVAWTFTSTG